MSAPPGVTTGPQPPPGFQASVGPFGPSTSLAGWNHLMQTLAVTLPTALNHAGYLRRAALRELASGRKVG